MPRLLVVDDDDGIRQVVADVFVSEGYDVDEAEDGLEALLRVDKRRPDIILLDLMMPRMNGSEFALAFHERPGGGEIPIILLSAAGDLPRASRALRPYGVRAFLAKPFDLDALLVLVSHFTAQPTAAPTG